MYRTDKKINLRFHTKSKQTLSYSTPWITSICWIYGCMNLCWSILLGNLHQSKGERRKGRRLSHKVKFRNGSIAFLTTSFASPIFNWRWKKEETAAVVFFIQCPIRPSPYNCQTIPEHQFPPQRLLNSSCIKVSSTNCTSISSARACRLIGTIWQLTIYSLFHIFGPSQSHISWWISKCSYS